MEPTTGGKMSEPQPKPEDSGITDLFDNSASESYCSSGDSGSETDSDYDTVDHCAFLRCSNDLAKEEDSVALAKIKKICKRAAPQSPGTIPPKVAMPDNLSPKLQAMQITAEGSGGIPKRQLFAAVPPTPRKGHIETVGHDIQEYADNRDPGISPDNAEEGTESSLPCGQPQTSESLSCKDIVDKLRSAKDRKNRLMGLFKDQLGFSFAQIVRPFKSDSTQSTEWVVMGSDLKLGIAMECLLANEGVMDVLQCWQNGICVLYLGFLHSKSRRAVQGLFKTAGCEVSYFTFEPPNCRSIQAALFWRDNCQCKKGGLPQWVTSTFMDGIMTEAFDMSTMVQWALDHKYFDEATICYQYAIEAGEDNSNAKLWLQSTSQLKLARDCAALARNMRRGEIQAMSMPEYVHLRLREYSGDQGRANKITELLHFQGTMLYLFLEMLRDCLHKKPKKCCIAIVGPPNSGKSMFTLSLMKFLGGAVLSYYSHNSHFWLQPLGECKIAVLDDATWDTWTYLDKYMRNALDGNLLTIDAKNKAPMQIECPPIIITSNYDITTGCEMGVENEEKQKEAYKKKYFYLHSRVTVLRFEKTIEGRNRQPRWVITPEDWKDFFFHYRQALQLTVDEEQAPDIDLEDLEDEARQEDRAAANWSELRRLLSGHE
ncbi:E1 [Hemidactylus frenatus papillomavirus 2]|uniref:Replication protein E1 n=1 Tax=Hemidactylus frenatus papillomavirus 2 TaxID=2670336 RepID=A0A649Z0R4_9PAPI|nr:E1 [Hemidactylus frenatus papillomavirus 2]